MSQQPEKPVNQVTITVYDITRVAVSVSVPNASLSQVHALIDATLAHGFYSDLSKLENIRSTPIGWVVRVADSGAAGNEAPKIHVYSVWKGLENPVCRIYLDNKPHVQATQIAVFEDITGLRINDLKIHTGKLPKKSEDKFKQIAVPVKLRCRLYYLDKGSHEEGKAQYEPLQWRAIVDANPYEEPDTPENAPVTPATDMAPYTPQAVEDDLRVRSVYSHWQHAENAIKILLKANIITPQSSNAEVVMALLQRKGVDKSHWSTDLEKVVRVVQSCQKITGFVLADFVEMNAFTDFATGRDAYLAAKEIYETVP